MSEEALPFELEAAVGVWDRHVAGCGRCLCDGNRLCDEGEYLAEDVELVREKISPAPAVPARRRFILPALRRPLFPGVPA